MSLPRSSDCERRFGGVAAVGFLMAIVVTAACRAGELTVSVIDPTGHGVADVVVIVAPAGPATSTAVSAICWLSSDHMSFRIVPSGPGIPFLFMAVTAR